MLFIHMLIAALAPRGIELTFTVVQAPVVLFPAVPTVAVSKTCTGHCITFANKTWAWVPSTEATRKAQLDKGNVVENGNGIRWFYAHDIYWLKPLSSLSVGSSVVIDEIHYIVSAKTIAPNDSTHIANAQVGAQAVLQTCETKDASVVLLVSLQKG